MSPEAIEIIVASDVTLRGQRWPGDGLSILLIHEPGIDRDLDLWRTLIPYLLGFGATIIALDLRGHGASDGDWDPIAAVDDIVAAVTSVRQQDHDHVVVCAAGDSAIAALRAAELTPIDGLVLLSPSGFEDAPPRGGGEPKLVISGNDAAAKETSARLRRSVIGPTLFVIVPGDDSGTGLFAGDVAVNCREQLLAFLRKIRFAETNQSVPDQFLDLLGIPRKGGPA
jgi:pimeloyl-ACP methyl ester carboxylesterase